MEREDRNTFGRQATIDITALRNLRQLYNYIGYCSIQFGLVKAIIRPK